MSAENSTIPSSFSSTQPLPIPMIALTSNVESVSERFSPIHRRGNINLKYSGIADLFNKVVNADSIVYTFQDRGYITGRGAQNGNG